MKLTSDWQEFDGDYEKVMQDVRTKDGTEHIKCWPNAGMFIVMDNETADVPAKEVTHVRKTIAKLW